METFRVTTRERTQLVDITGEVQKIVRNSGVRDGLCTIFTPHTTAAITINENADPNVQRDIKMKINDVFNDDPRFRHAEGNSDAHIKSSLFGCQEQVIIENGNLVLGTWQGLYFCEFDGPRTRKVHVQILES